METAQLLGLGGGLAKLDPMALNMAQWQREGGGDQSETRRRSRSSSRPSSRALGDGPPGPRALRKNHQGVGEGQGPRHDSVPVR